MRATREWRPATLASYRAPDAFDKWDRVPTGALIADLASEQARAQLEQAEHALHTAREQLAQA